MGREQRSNLGLNLGSAFYYPCDFEQVSDSVVKWTSVKWLQFSPGCWDEDGSLYAKLLGRAWYLGAQ